jgi:esterase/lipase superfamily enzyme
MKTLFICFRWIGLSLVLLFLGCSSARVMMPTPNLYLNAEVDPYLYLTDEQKSSSVQIFYFTDRLPEKNEKGDLTYSYGRSGSLAFGTASVDLGKEISWEELYQASLIEKRLKPVKMALGQVTELVRAPYSPIPYKLVEGQIIEEPSVLAERKHTVQAVRRILVEKLALTPRKEVFIYIHGYKNTFSDAAFAMAEFWHFLGRIGVPIIYTWPAGYPAGLIGYTYDRESSEFTVYHLRETLGFLASIPEVEKIHVIAHSRGTDVAVSALRELTLRTRAEGIDPKLKFKIHNFVLAAPDLDIKVAEQRIDGDKLAISVKRFTIYTSPDDRAIGLAKRLFRSPQGRIGNFKPEDMTVYQKDMAAFYGAADFAIIQFPGASDSYKLIGDRYGHSYFRNAPTVSSDLVIMLRDDLDPGPPGRPLEYVGSNYWRIPPGYPDNIPTK